mmetsp:Transcript_17971/g.27212  ORF Transcript_17971/g.27212 Transcript_17971/m.27212 type:complete len:223 (-) Transcript_17971:695-1363(-)
MLSFLRTLSAYISPVLISLTRNTFPKEPFPITLIILKESSLGAETGAFVLKLSPRPCTNCPFACSIAFESPPTCPSFFFGPGLCIVTPYSLSSCDDVCGIFLFAISACSFSDWPKCDAPKLWARDPISSTISTSDANAIISISSSLEIASSVGLYRTEAGMKSSSSSSSSSAITLPSSSSNISSISMSSRFVASLVDNLLPVFAVSEVLSCCEKLTQDTASS